MSLRVECRNRRTGGACCWEQFSHAALDRTAGEQLELLRGEPPYRIAGVFRSVDVFENGSVLMSIDELQALMVREGEVTQIAVNCRQQDPESIERLQGQIADLAPGVESFPTAQFVDSSVEVRIAEAVSWLTSTVALVIGTFGVVNTMSSAVLERTGEIALLRAVGWRKQSVFKLVLCESALMGIAGAIAGNNSGHPANHAVEFATAIRALDLRSGRAAGRAGRRCRCGMRERDWRHVPRVPCRSTGSRGWTGPRLMAKSAAYGKVPLPAVPQRGTAGLKFSVNPNCTFWEIGRRPPGRVPSRKWPTSRKVQNPNLEAAKRPPESGTTLFRKSNQKN